MSDMEAVNIKVVIKLLRLAIRNDCPNEVADGVTQAAIETLEELVA